MQIAPVGPDDFEIWKRMRCELYTGLNDSFHDYEMESIRNSPDAQSFLLKKTDGTAIGLLELSLRNIVDGCVGSPVGYIEGIYLLPACRGQGYGRKLIAFAEQWCREQGCQDIATDAELENSEAQDFYRHAGFIEGWRIVEFRKSLRQNNGAR